MTEQRTHRRRFLAVLLVLIVGNVADAAEPVLPEVPPFKKDNFVVAEGLAIEPFAVEQLSNPASIDVDDRGRVWVAEAFNYRKKARAAGGPYPDSRG